MNPAPNTYREIARVPVIPKLNKEQVGFLTDLCFRHDDVLKKGETVDLIFVFSTSRGNAELGAVLKDLLSRGVSKEVFVTGGFAPYKEADSASMRASAVVPKKEEQKESEADLLLKEIAIADYPDVTFWRESTSRNTLENVTHALAAHDFSDSKKYKKILFIFKSAAAGRGYLTLRKFLPNTTLLQKTWLPNSYQKNTSITRENWHTTHLAPMVWGEFLRIKTYGGRGDIYYGPEIEELVKKIEVDAYIPLDKSWIIRMGILDIVHGYHHIETFLAEQEGLGDDLLALKKVSETWQTSDTVDVGESGTLYRLLKFASWKRGLNKKFIIRGTLKNRVITDDPSIVNLPIEKLLMLDNATSQWATASVLLGNTENSENLKGLEHMPYKLQVTYDAVEHWNAKWKAGKVWQLRRDETIMRQAETFLKLLAQKNKSNQNQKMSVLAMPEFIAEQAEDFCFAYTFGYLSKEEGEKRWPSLRGHESDRIFEMEASLEKAKRGEPVDSRDHRVVQAIALWAVVNGKKLGKDVVILHPEAVNKSWPQFWDFLNMHSL